ncbi:MAG: aminotransferase class I/II-fold pyridoxal phosphate-dependent enzyme [Clostridia bacterium]|nr:aminotransferase class I/II-fold pyridoxal phosphate-dependent enzyme [Clostridia bacterium]
MYSFSCDYEEGAHERILAALLETNRVQTPGYGEDVYCEQAAALLKDRAQSPNSRVYFFVGGTQANCTAISAFLRPHQGVIAASTGHIAAHESGGVEASGHKVLTLPSPDGKLTAGQVEQAVRAHFDDVTHEHMVQPAMVYISHPSEVGTIYSLQELTTLSGVCRREGLLLYLDGARLGCALNCEQSDVTLADIARLTDAFYIGGTKMGALFGEAMLVNTPGLDRDFRYIQKQRSGRLAKGRLLGIQFIELFKDSLYMDLAAHANRMAQKLRDGIAALGYDFYAPSPTNQIFPILPSAVLSVLSKAYGYSPWCRVDEHNEAIRLCTSWATEEAQVDAFLAALQKETAK